MNLLKKLVAYLWAGWLGYMVISLASIAWSPGLGEAGLSPELCREIARLSASHFSRTCWICLSVLLSVTVLYLVAARATKRQRGPGGQGATQD